MRLALDEIACAASRTIQMSWMPFGSSNFTFNTRFNHSRHGGIVEYRFSSR
jgi:hypothetical protein